MEAVIQEALDHARGAWRFRWYALLAACVLAVGAWIGIFAMRDSYEAQARVFVDADTALSEVTRGISVETDPQTEIQRVRQAMLGAPTLQKVAEDTDLFLKADTPRDRQEIIEGLRENIGISASTNNRSSGLYVITYQNPDRELAIRVVDRLLNTFVEGSLGGKREGSEQAERFLKEQIADYERRLTESEDRLAAFKKKNVGMMPGAQGDYFTRLQTEMEELRKLETMYPIAVRRRDELGKALRGEDPVIPSAAGSGGALGPQVGPQTGVQAGGTGGALGNQLGGATDTSMRIREVESSLDNMLLRFTDQHPDVIATRGILADLKKRQAEELESARRGDPGAVARSGMSANPVFQSLQLAYKQAGVEAAAIQAMISESRGKIAQLRGQVDTAPGVEAEFARLNRDYDATKAQYEALVGRLEKTRVSGDAQQTGVVQFEVIDPPTAKFDPVKPNRPVLIALALAAALGAGGGLAFLLHLMSPVVNTSRQLGVVTGLPVLGEVSMTWLEKYRATERRGMLVYAGAVGGLLLVTGIVIIVQWRIVALVRELA